LFSKPSRILERQFPCLNRLVPLATVEPFPEHEQYPNAFNNTAVQYINPDVIERQEEAFWELPEEMMRETEESRGEHTEAAK